MNGLVTAQQLARKVGLSDKEVMRKLRYQKIPAKKVKVSGGNGLMGQYRIMKNYYDEQQAMAILVASVI
jgi:hypothetical protein